MDRLNDLIESALIVGSAGALGALLVWHVAQALALLLAVS